MIRSCLLLALASALLLGCGTPSFLITPVANTSELDETTVVPGKGFSSDKIAIVEIDGMLMNAKSGGFLQPTENPLSLFVEQMQRAQDDSRVKAVVLRVNSPGGTVTASDTMYQIVKRFKAKTHKPVIASAQEICASGAYYVSCAADEIVAQPTSLVGSIGVIFNTLDVTDTMAKLGLRSETIKDNDGIYKDLASPFHHMTSDERSVLQAMVEEDFTRFKGIVTTNRRINDIPTATTGRVFSGQDALALGLVDQTGLLEDAIDLAKSKANTPNASVIMYKRPYGYEGSIYADSSMPAPQANSQINLALMADSHMLLPTGFYYLWQP